MNDAAIESPELPQEPWRISRAANAAVATIVLAVTGANLHFFYTRGLSNLYGDGLAHMEGARRIFDSLTPGYDEIGSVWLPVYHLICAPLAINDFLWHSGLAGGIVSSTALAMVCYLLFRLGAEINRNLAAGIVALAGAIACPSFLYLATTPLTEPLALMWSVLVAYALFCYSRSGSWKSLIGAAMAAFLGSLTRYEGWNALPFATILVVLVYPYPWRQRVVRAVFFAAVGGSGPLLWIIHNAYRYNNPLQFYNGLASAKDIYAHQIATTAFPYPTDGSLLISARYYLEDLKLVIGVWGLALALLGLVAWCVSLRESRRGLVAVLFIVPLPFYFQAMAHAAVPLYVPTLFPHTYYNIRYGVEMIAAVALLPSFVFFPDLSKRIRSGLLVAFLAVLGWQFLRLTAGGPESLPVVKEGLLNTPCRSERQLAMIDFLRAHYDGRRILMTAGAWPCVIPGIGARFRDTISNNNQKYRMELATNPTALVGWIIRSDGDPINALMQSYPWAFADFKLVDQGEFSGEGDFKIYRFHGR